MSKLVYKPYKVVSEEWAETCVRFRKAQAQINSILFPEYPSDANWDKYPKVRDKYEAILSEMEDYRKTVRFSD